VAKAWKFFQKWVAKKTGGKVIPRSHYGDSVPDVISPGFLWECKRTEELPKWLKNAVAQAKGYAKGEYADLIPVAVFGEPYYKTVIVAMDFWDFWAMVEEYVLTKAEEDK